MAYTAEQQARLTAAQAKINATKPIYEGFVARYNSYVGAITCYGGTFPTVEAAATWANPDRSSCTRAGSCTGNDKNSCQANVDDMNQNIIPGLRGAYNNYQQALANYNIVLAAVAKESGSDPANVSAAAAEAAKAAAAEAAKAKKLKYILIFVAVIVIVAGFIYFKFIRKK